MGHNRRIGVDDWHDVAYHFWKGALMGSGTGLGQVRGLGSAKHGAGHWWLQRVTAIGNLLLVLWFIFSLLRLPSLDHEVVTSWLSSPLAAVPMALLVINVFWHFRIGLQVVVIAAFYQGETRLRPA